ncbi:TnsA-like heteromeric transposase endonuclease subunit [Embleya sp. MST-111070]|uniref:TnsA-like heteromeric transposase endonuclease subunit n=1 Tax=Embleya sp. MST-111070 TaxID=3398231 RepID=UPI003F733795
MPEISIAYTDENGRALEVPADRAGGIAFEELPHPRPPIAHRGRRGFVTDGWVSGTGRTLALGSLRQQHVAMLLDRDPSVGAFAAGPVELRWSAGGREHALRPDFLARLTTGVRALVAVVPDRPATDWDARVRILRAAASQAGWQVRTLSPPRGVRLANLQLAFAARDPRGRDERQARLLLGAFARPRPLTDGARACPLPTLVALELAWHLIWRGRLHVDWDTPIVPDSSPAWAARPAPEGGRR